MTRLLFISLICIGIAHSAEVLSIKEKTILRMGISIGKYQAAMKLSDALKSKDHIRYMLEQIAAIKAYGQTIEDVLLTEGRDKNEIFQFMNDIGFHDSINMEKPLRDKIFIIENK